MLVVAMCSCHSAVLVPRTCSLVEHGQAILVFLAVLLGVFVPLSGPTLGGTLAHGHSHLIGGQSGPVIEQIQRKTRVRDRTPQNAPRTRPGVEKEDQKAELKNNQTCRRYVEKTTIFFQTTGRHPPGARRETTEVKTRKC